MTSSSSLGYVTARPTQPTFGKVIAATLWSYVGPGIFAIGIVGNILILVAMAQRRMHGTSTCVYLRCMAVADLAVLLTGMIPEWLEARNIVTVKVSNAGLVAEWLGDRTCDRQVAGPNPGRRTAECNPAQVVYTQLCLCHQTV